MAWLRDPLFVFLLAGAGIFAAAEWLRADDIPYTIEVRNQDLQRLNDQWAMQMRRPPSERELQGLVEQFIKEEIYYREAQRLGLDRNDTIVRRRMVQKLTFLTEDIATAAPLDDADLRAYYEVNDEAYRLPERFSFRHRYFSSDRRPDAEADATRALQNTELPGDPFMLQKNYAIRTARDIGDDFGRSFATVLSSLAVSDDWQGPVQSAFGWHAILITARHPAALEPFERVRERVRADAQTDTRKEANAAYFDTLKARYDIQYPADI